MPPAFNLSRIKLFSLKLLSFITLERNPPRYYWTWFLRLFFANNIYANASTHTNYLIKLLKNILQKKRIASNFVAIRCFNQSRTHHDTEYYRFWLVLLMLHHFWFCYETPFSQRKWIIASNYTWSTFIWFFLYIFLWCFFQLSPNSQYSQKYQQIHEKTYRIFDWSMFVYEWFFRKNFFSAQNFFWIKGD